MVSLRYIKLIEDCSISQFSHCSFLPKYGSEQCRLERALEWQRNARIHAAATLIQSNYKCHIIRNYFITQVYLKYISEATPPTIIIQKKWRMYKSMSTMKFRSIVETIQKKCIEKILRISHKFKGK